MSRTGAEINDRNMERRRPRRQFGSYKRRTQPVLRDDAGEGAGGPYYSAAAAASFFGVGSW